MLVRKIGAIVALVVAVCSFAVHADVLPRAETAETLPECLDACEAKRNRDIEKCGRKEEDRRAGCHRHANWRNGRCLLACERRFAPKE